jgi:release factor glutamine methyltransferase
MARGSSRPEQTIADVVRAAAARLSDAGIVRDDAVFDAEVLARHVLGWDRARYLVGRTEPAPDTFEARYQHVIDRRARREPVHLILGEREFWGRPFLVSRDVLSPRPETELVVETALDVIRHLPLDVRIADVGTGSGCLGITLALERPQATVVATDISAAALNVARRNAERHGVSKRVRWVRGDLLRGLRATFDVIVANPPYVPSDTRAGLPPEVREYDPPVALFAGVRGLDAIRRLLSQAPERLAPCGSLVMEFGSGQDEELEELARQSSLDLVAVKNDLQGIPRVAVLRLEA